MTRKARKNYQFVFFCNKCISILVGPVGDDTPLICSKCNKTTEECGQFKQPEEIET